MKILCTLENASEEINGVKFDLIPGLGRVADVEDEAKAAIFLSINGYEEFDEDAAPVEALTKPAAKAPAAAPKQTKAGAKKAPATAPAPEPEPEPEPEVVPEREPAAPAADDGDDSVF